tara:strand:- start:115 stop:1104 length:990 start_codon:yes stop_codon:yes gene_type:complete
MKKSIIKKLFIKLSKIMGYEIIDQNSFISPTLERELNKDLSILNEKSIVLPLGEVKISRKVKSILILFRTNSNIEIWDQNKKRLFELPKVEYTLRSLNSLLKSINFCKEKYPSIEIKLTIIDDSTNENNLNKIKNLTNKNKFNIKFEKVDHQKYKNIIKDQKNEQTYSNLSSLFCCYEIAKKNTEDLVFFVEDDYIHFEPMMEEMIASYERISSQLSKDIFMCPADYPYLYMDNQKTNILIGNKRHWRTIDKTLCTFMTSKKLLEKYWDNFYKTCLDRNDPFEKYINDIYISEVCISPLKSLSVHFTNVNSSYGLSPFIDYKKLWNENE